MDLTTLNECKLPDNFNRIDDYKEGILTFEIAEEQYRFFNFEKKCYINSYIYQKVSEDEEIITAPEKEIEEAEKTIEEVKIEVSEKEPQKQEGILKKEITETELKRIIKEEIENSKPKEKIVNTSDNSSKIKAEVIPEKKAIAKVQEPPKKKTYKKRVLKVPPADAEPAAGLEEMLSVAEQRSENISEEIKKPSVADRVQKINNSSKRDVILAWRKEHPDGNKTACMKETGASMATVRKWWSLYEEIE